MTFKETAIYRYLTDAGSSDKDTALAYTLKDIVVVKEHDGRENPWPGTHKNVYYWYELANGKAIGHNENPAIGWSFPVITYKRGSNA